MAEKISSLKWFRSCEMRQGALKRIVNAAAVLPTGKAPAAMAVTGVSFSVLVIMVIAVYIRIKVQAAA